ncbi:putative Ionotropic receptor 7e [Daphnia magna]|uniref:Putative Ionotropic receptor 7e n=1 Tax=Daphnia magna TaxID=35525 RepID=A0A164W5H1_9CRUS|nr:putative Ionotropic receptor 7e [Daphnia magna]
MSIARCELCHLSTCSKRTFMLLCIHLTTLPFRYHHLPDYKVMGNLCRRLVGVLVLLTVFTENAITQLYGQDAVHSNLLNGKTLRVASVEILPFVEFLRNENGDITEGRGFSFEILNALMETYNFSITIKIPKDEAYGALLPNGTWNGMIAMILNNESDVGIGSFSVTHMRHQFVDFTVAYYEESSGIMIPAPVRGKQLSTFIKPFQFQVWMILMGILVVLPFVMWMQSKLLAKAQRTNPKKQLAFIYGVLLTQSGQKIPEKEHSLRLLAMIWFLCALVFIHAYIGTLVSFLSVPNLKPVIRSLDELPASGLGWIVWSGSDLESLFLEATDGIYRIIGDQLRQHPERLVDFLVEGEQAVKKGGFAYMNNKARIKYAVEKDFISSGFTCNLDVAKETFYKVNQAFALPKGSPIGAFFNKKILSMLESGLMEHWRKKHLSGKDHCSAPHSYGALLRKLNFDDLKSAFLIWFVGVCIALMVFVVENIVYFSGKTEHHGT